MILIGCLAKRLSSSFHFALVLSLALAIYLVHYFSNEQISSCLAIELMLSTCWCRPASQCDLAVERTERTQLFINRSRGLSLYLLRVASVSMSLNRSQTAGFIVLLPLSGSYHKHDCVLPQAR